MLGVGWTIKQLGSKHSDHQSQPSSNCLHINHWPNLSDLVSHDAGNWIEWFGAFANSIKQVSHVWGKQIIFLVWRESFFVSKRRNEEVRFVSGSHWWIRHEWWRFSLGEGCCIMTFGWPFPQVWLCQTRNVSLIVMQMMPLIPRGHYLERTVPNLQGGFSFFLKNWQICKFAKNWKFGPCAVGALQPEIFIDALRAIWVEWNSSKYGTAARTTCSWMEECKGTDNLTEFLVCVFDTLKMKVPGKSLWQIDCWVPAVQLWTVVQSSKSQLLLVKTWFVTSEYEETFGLGLWENTQSAIFVDCSAFVAVSGGPEHILW